MHLLIQSTHILQPTRHTFAAGLMDYDTSCTGARSVSEGLLTFHMICTMLACLWARAPVCKHGTEGWEVHLPPLALSLQTGTTQRDKQQMCHTGWNQNSRPAWSCAHHQTWLLWWGGEAASAAGRWDKAAPLLLPASCLGEDRPVCMLLWHS